MLWKRLFNLPGLKGLLGAENREMLSFGLWLAPLTTGTESDVPFPFGMADGMVVTEMRTNVKLQRPDESVNVGLRMSHKWCDCWVTGGDGLEEREKTIYEAATYV